MESKPEAKALEADSSVRRRVKLLIAVAAFSGTIVALIYFGDGGTGIPTSFRPSEVLDLVGIPGGTLETDEIRWPKPKQKRSHLRPFLLSRTEVTRGQWRALGLPEPEKWSRESFDSDSIPANYVLRSDAAKFCNALSAREGLSPFYDDHERDSGSRSSRMSYRLPTDVEWEHACRADPRSDRKEKYHFGNDDARLKDYEWYFLNSGERELAPETRWDTSCMHEWKLRPRPVGLKLPNGFGLLDISGNVREWCEEGTLRGGSFWDDASALSCKSRNIPSQYERFDYQGFRVARSVESRWFQ